MATVVTPDQLAEVLTARIQRKLKLLESGNPRLKEIMFRIGAKIEGEAKLNIRRAGLIDTGRLINSIRHFVFVKGQEVDLVVGSFAVPYAAVHEFGFNGSVNVSGFSRRGHNRREHVRTRRGSPQTVRAHEVRGHSVRGHQRAMQIKGTHYLSRAADTAVGSVPRIIGQMFRKGR